MPGNIDDPGWHRNHFASSNIAQVEVLPKPSNYLFNISLSKMRICISDFAVDRSGETKGIDEPLSPGKQVVAVCLP